jgi:acyl-CoA thioesterase-1
MKWNWLAVVATPLLLMGCGKPAPDDGKNDVNYVTTYPSGVADQTGHKTILALGDSLFAGYGLKPGESYPAHLEAALNARGIPNSITNAGVSGDTTADGLARVDFVLSGMKQKPVLAIISLGGNDMLRAVPPAETRKNLAAILAKFEAAKVPVVLLQLLAAPNLGKEYADQFNPIYPSLAKQYGATLVPFWLAPLQGHPELLQADHIHPTLPGIDKLVAGTIDRIAGALPKSAPPAPR